MSSRSEGFEVYAFDAYGTLFDVHSAVSQCAEHLGERGLELSDLWRQKQLEYSWVRTLSGSYRDFEAVTEDALVFAMNSLGIESPRLKASLLGTYQVLRPYPEVDGALRALKKEGKTLAVLSNGTPGMIGRALSSAGLGGLIDEVVSTHESRAFKTRTDLYGLVCDRLGVRGASVSFQSANRWDIAGATKFGFWTVWVNRNSQPDEYLDLKPDRIVASLGSL